MCRPSPHSPTAIISLRRAVWCGPAALRRCRHSRTCSSAILVCDLAAPLRSLLPPGEGEGPLSLLLGHKAPHPCPLPGGEGVKTTGLCLCRHCVVFTSAFDYNGCAAAARRKR